MTLQHMMAWGLFVLLVLVLLAVDLLLLHRKPHAIEFKEALLGALLPVGAAALFAGGLYLAYANHWMGLGVLPASVHPGSAAEKFFPDTGPEATLLFCTGYLVELSLSADNVFLFVVLLAFFKVPRALQHRVLFWGVIGAVVMRGAMILAAAELTRFEWVIYLFGAFLLFTGCKMFLAAGEPKDPSNNLAVRLVRKFLPVKDGFDGQRFVTRVNGRRFATTLLLVLVCVELTDLVFALDSIPAIFGITRDAFLVFTSNVFAILGLRSMYFLLAGVMDRFHLLKYGLALVLGFVGVKMVLPGAAAAVNHFTGGQHVWEIDKYVSLGVILLCLAGSVAASLAIPSRRHLRPQAPAPPKETKPEKLAAL